MHTVPCMFQWIMVVVALRKSALIRVVTIIPITRIQNKCKRFVMHAYQ